MRIQNITKPYGKLPAERTVYLPRVPRLWADICPMTFNGRLFIGDEDVTAWMELHGIAENDWELVRNYDKGLWYDIPVLVFKREADAVIFALRWL